ncbi:MAG: biotin/lipoyl-binding protein [Bacteroidales bacterium]|nr:biotin/lipoyl-binding protein [Bacteroidales bacterium]
MKLKTGLFSFAALALFLLVILWLLSRNPREVYSYAEVGYSDIASTMTISGKISPEKEVQIRPRISAHVSDILVECGDKVKKGQRLVILEAIPDVFALEEANAAVELEKIAQKQAQTDFERAKVLYAGKSISTKESCVSTKSCGRFI